MQYQGGKTGTAKGVAPFLLAHANEGATYFEPFLGAGSVATLVAPAFKRAHLTDAMPDLILLWQALAEGWEPPTEVSEEEYRDLRYAEPSALRGFVGFGCSFGGKWFGGYARASHGYTYAGMSARSLAKKIAKLKGAEFALRDYREVDPLPGDVVYCDPPYANTTAYAGAGAFDSEEFWRRAEGWAMFGAHVFVSEYEAPSNDWEAVWSRPRTARMRGSGSQVDSLYAWRGVQL